MGSLEGKVAIVTGAGQGVGRAHARFLAAEGARVVVNDIGDGADETVELVKGAGGRAVVNRDSVSDWSTGEALVAQALDAYGDLHIVVNNAGFLRNAMSFSMTEDEFDAVVAVHLKGHFVCTRAAVAWWREQAKAGIAAPRRIIHTTSEAGLFGAPGQSNYSAAKGALIALSLALAREVTKYGVTTNVIAPRARTPMTATQTTMMPPDDPEAFDPFDPDNVPPFVAWLCTDEAADINAQLFIVGSDGVWLMRAAGHVRNIRNGGKRWTLEDISARRDDLFADDDTGVLPFAQPTFAVD